MLKTLTGLFVQEENYANILFPETAPCEILLDIFSARCRSLLIVVTIAEKYSLFLRQR